MKNEVIKLVSAAVAKRGLKIPEKDLEKFLGVPPNPELGDFSFACFFLAGKFKEMPNETSVKLREVMEKLKGFDNFEDVQAVNGYLNFFIDRKALVVNVIREVVAKGHDYGKIDFGKGQKYLIEHTSINPNASPHVGRVRNALIGDSLVKIFNFLGYKTEVHYYVNDVSKQIAMLALANADKLKFQQMLKRYALIANKVKKSKKLEKKVFGLLEDFESQDKEIMAKFKKITDTCVKGQEKILAQLGIKYDFFDYESNYILGGKETLELLRKSGKIFKDEDGREILDLKGTPIEGQMKTPVLVLTRSDGTGLYQNRDIAYTIEKMKKSDKNLIVLGEDQKLYFQQIREALKILGYKSPEVVHYSYVLISNAKGKSKKMSTRKGDVVLLEDFLDDAIEKAKKEIKKRKTKGDANKVGIGAVKYTILKNANNKEIKFNLDEALSFEGDTGPYLLYSYARANSILKKIKKSFKGDLDMKKIGELHEKEIELSKKISEFPETILKSFKDLNPSYIANYSYQLAQTFNEFYHTCPVINADHKENQEFRIVLVMAFKQTLANSLGLLGIEPIDEM